MQANRLRGFAAGVVRSGVTAGIMDSNTVMFITVPIVSPLVASMGYDLVWWGVINLVVLETGLITPRQLGPMMRMLPRRAASST